MAENKLVVDARGDACPIPVVKSLKALGTLGGPGEVETIVDNKIAVENLERMGKTKGCHVVVDKVAEKEWHVRINTDKELAPATGEDISCDVTPRHHNVVVQIASETMGTGDDTLGAKLMGSFIYSLTQLDELPATIVLYNGGARLTCEASPYLGDLRDLSDAGVEILTCGTCLDFYELGDKLAVGEVTNMYVIAQKLSAASVVVRP